ncbi:MAG: glycosyltransferase family 9 protein [Betaproteobacteria bacterium]
MKVLLVRAGALGDVLLLRRSIAALRFAGHRVELLAPAAGAALVGAGASEVDRVWPWDGAEVTRVLSGDGTPGPFADALRSADAVVAYTRSRSLTDALRSRARLLLVHDPAPPARGPHASQWFAQALTTLGVPEGPEPPELRFSGEEQAWAETLLRRLPPRFLAFHPGSGSDTKNWPADRFLALAERLHDDPALGPHPSLLVLGPAEADGVSPAAPATGTSLPEEDMPSLVVARELPLRVLGAVLSRAGFYVGNDSGVSHLAAAAGAPALALFGPTDPALWAPVGRHVRCLRAPRARMAQLTVEVALESARGLLRSAQGAAQ